MVYFQTLSFRQFQFSGIEPQLMQDGGVDIGDIMAILDRMKSNFIRRTMNGSALDSSPGKPDRKTEDMMVSPV
jgi:hypothetical protein